MQTMWRRLLPSSPPGPRLTPPRSDLPRMVRTDCWWPWERSDSAASGPASPSAPVPTCPPSHLSIPRSCCTGHTEGVPRVRPCSAPTIRLPPRREGNTGGRHADTPEGGQWGWGLSLLCGGWRVPHGARAAALPLPEPDSAAVPTRKPQKEGGPPYTQMPPATHTPHTRSVGPLEHCGYGTLRVPSPDSAGETSVGAVTEDVGLQLGLWSPGRWSLPPAMHQGHRDEAESQSVRGQNRTRSLRWGEGVCG